MKCPEEKTKWSLVTRTWKRSAMIRSGVPSARHRPRHLRRQGNDTLAEGDEQASRDEVGGGAGVAAVAVGAEPGVELGEGAAAGARVRPEGFNNCFCSPTR